MARLIKTEKEVEGHYSEQWLLVEEDALDQWPQGARRVVGRPAARVDGPAKVRGEAIYTADVQLTGMLHTAILRSPHAHARVHSIDLAPALASPGVRAVLGPGDLEELTREPGYPGAPIAAVAADSFEQAQAAVERVAVEYRLLEPLLDPEEAQARGQLIRDPVEVERGDFAQGLAEADVVVEATYRTPTLLHSALETHQAVAQWEGDVLTVHLSTQFIWGARAEIAERLGIPEEKVQIVCKYMGGGFGAKISAGDYGYAAIELARRTGRPVRCALSRREENLASGNRHATIQRLVAAARFDGRLTALGGEFLMAVGWSGFQSSTAGPMQMLYACPNLRTVEHGARINTSPNAAFRAPGFVEGVFALECLMDELAARLELDPLELRRINHTELDPSNGSPLSDKNLLECYRRAEPHWQRRPQVRARSQGPWKRGVGLASQIWYGGGGPPSYAWIRVSSSGRAHLIIGGQDIGTGTSTAFAQIAAEELGLPLERVTISWGESQSAPYATISGGSSMVPSIGPAVRAAAADAARQILELACQRYQLDGHELSLENGRVVSATGGSWPIEEVTGLLGSAQIVGKGSRGPNPSGMRVLTFGIQLAEVAVDVETGEVKVERVVAIHDIGRVINPLGASSQVEGGIIQALGHTLSEQRLLDPASGTVLTQTLDAYRLPTVADVPEIVTELLDIPDRQLTNLGSKGLGEPPIIPTAAAIVNAIRDATGADVRSIPVTRETMLEALEAHERALATQAG